MGGRGEPQGSSQSRGHLSRRGIKKGTSGEEPHRGGKRKGLGAGARGAPGPQPARIPRGRSKDAGSPPSWAPTRTATPHSTPAAGRMGRQEGRLQVRAESRGGGNGDGSGEPPAAGRTAADSGDGSGLRPHGAWSQGQEALECAEGTVGLQQVGLQGGLPQGSHLGPDRCRVQRVPHGPVEWIVCI